LDILNLFAEIGVILLLFIVGMEFPIEKLRNIGKKALVIAMTEALGTFAIGFVVAQSLHYSVYNSLFLALAISVTSTVIVMRILEELDLIKHEASSIILGVAVIEDIIIISMLAILQSIGSTASISSSSSSSLFPNLAVSVGTVLAFIVGVLIIGSKTIPKFVNYIGKTNQHDLLIVAVLGVAFGLSFIAQEIGISVATGAFFAGVLIAESKISSVTKVLATPLKDMFAAIFFVSVGALMDISVLPMFIVPALILIIVSIAAKFLTVVIAARAQKISLLTSIRSAFGLSSSGGELALVVAKGGADVGGSTSSFLLPMVGTMTIITTFVTPYMIKFGWKIGNSISEHFENRKKEV
jgi:CPA2 family monovalent cation:H+ antiporter-2